MSSLVGYFKLHRVGQTSSRPKDTSVILRVRLTILIYVISVALIGGLFIILLLFGTNNRSRNNSYGVEVTG